LIIKDLDLILLFDFVFSHAHAAEATGSAAQDRAGDGKDDHKGYHTF